MEKAGFKNLSFETIALSPEFKDEDQFLKGFVDGSPLSKFLAKKGDRFRTEFITSLKSAFEQQSLELGRSVPMQALVVSAFS